MKKLLIAVLSLTCLSAFAYPKIELTEDNSIAFNQAFTSRYVSLKQSEAANKCLSGKVDDIYIVMYSPGGSVNAGGRFIDFLHALPCDFHTINLFSASMSYITAQSLGDRLITPSGVLMSHRASIRGIGGEIGGELDAILKMIKDNIQEIDTRVAKRVGVSVEAYQKLISDELWLTADKAVKTNHADKIVYAVCSKELSGTYEQVVNTFFGSYLVEFSNCPLITGPLSVTSSRGDVNRLLDYYNNIEDYVTTEL